ncbi:adenylate/guanylate cyclase domain-containing protein [Exilibacterium tricleocarpae]|uniref:Adenylate/guanylate cyclase domain-containing protein n=1 Tax=Exilibacterium tricleocarpae TaxID=2591008 RepID=A0A545SMV1_9GAMM|nr:adenylate/guanylate cyclase domain-containing protein [Exilibacterium tricleocarpae]TQV66293.1 adenylate/guanylate cyclase domain-containing protein [Exilibacterium tricleocarpae]
MDNESSGKHKKSTRVVSPLYFRVILILTGAGALAEALSWAQLNAGAAALCVLMVVYTVATLLAEKNVAGERIEKLKAWMGSADAGLIGAALAATAFSPLPCILLVICLQFHALLNGGMRRWARDTLGLAVGAGAGVLIQPPAWPLAWQWEFNAVSLTGAVIYFVTYGLFLFERTTALSRQNQQLQNEQHKYKLRAYKLSRYLPPPVWNAVNKGDDKALKTCRKRLTVFFSDIKGFSRLSEELEAETLTDILNTYLTEMAKIATHHGGTIDKFIGDAIMITFGDGSNKGVKADALDCLAMAIAMKKRMKVLQQQWYNQGVGKPLRIRMGINTGYCTVGTFGTNHHLDYTVLGTHVNLASRLESAAEPGEILISYETWSLVKDVIMCRDKGNILVKGFSYPVKVYQVADFRKDLGKEQSYFEDNAEGFNLHLDLEKVRNYDKERVIESLETAADKLREKVIT